MTLQRALLILALFAAFFAGVLFTKRTAQQTEASTRDGVLYYHCPMHPSYKSDRPGDAPCCGMRLEPVRAGGERSPNRIQVSEANQQLLGIVTSEAQATTRSVQLRVAGRIAPDERRVFRVNTSVSGWIRKTFTDTAGSLVERDRVLATYYTREFLTAQNAYFYALDALERFGKTNPNELQLLTSRNQVQGAKDTLSSLGMSDMQIEALGKTRKPVQDIELRAPVTGFVLARRVSPGLRFNAGDELYVLADLSRVWVLADITGWDAPSLRPGVMAEVTLPQGAGKRRAVISDILPQFDASAQTLRARLELDNPGYALRPGMFVDVTFETSAREAVRVPAAAVLDSGLQKTVFVARADGVFERREVETGAPRGGEIEIRHGVSTGERVVVSGNFLLDSEARMRSTQRKATATDPICGMEVEIAGARFKADKAGRTYYFCSEGCLREHRTQQ